MFIFVILKLLFMILRFRLTEQRLEQNGNKTNPRMNLYSPFEPEKEFKVYNLCKR